MFTFSCDCHGHGQSCDLSVEPYECECAANTYTRGRQCDTCEDGTFREDGSDDYAVGLCASCACEVNGTVGQMEDCKQVSKWFHRWYNKLGLMEYCNQVSTWSYSYTCGVVEYSGTDSGLLADEHMLYQWCSMLGIKTNLTFAC